MRTIESLTLEAAILHTLLNFIFILRLETVAEKSAVAYKYRGI
jgi:hypothetical protein